MGLGNRELGLTALNIVFYEEHLSKRRVPSLAYEYKREINMSENTWYQMKKY